VTEDESIPLLDLGAEHGPLMDELTAATERVIRSGQFILGPEVQALEEEIAGKLGVQHAIGVSSGTDALLVSLMSLGVGPGDEVVTTPFSFFASAGCIARLGARPVFADIDPNTFNLDPQRVAEVVTKRTKAILPVHLFGQPANMGALREVAGEIPLVEDAAQALGAYDEGFVGGLGSLGCFSFFPTKNLGGAGDGGLVTTNDDALAEEVRVLRVHGAKPKYHHARIGGNFRLDAIQAAMLRVKLPHLDGWTEARRQNAARYDSMLQQAGLTPSPIAPPPRVKSGHVYNQYVIRAPGRDALRAHLTQRQIASAVYYPVPLHLQPCFEDLGYKEGDLPEAERACREVLALPLYPELTEAQQGRVVEAIRAYSSA
jgi:dTDP-4-amino-4,6-dideoxygalactose transaminase